MSLLNQNFINMHELTLNIHQNKFTEFLTFNVNPFHIITVQCTRS